jgi:hypothetical protein
VLVFVVSEVVLGLDSKVFDGLSELLDSVLEGVDCMLRVVDSVISGAFDELSEVKDFVVETLDSVLELSLVVDFMASEVELELDSAVVDELSPVLGFVVEIFDNVLELSRVLDPKGIEFKVELNSKVVEEFSAVLDFVVEALDNVLELSGVVDSIASEVELKLDSAVADELSEVLDFVVETLGVLEFSMILDSIASEFKVVLDSILFDELSKALDSILVDELSKALGSLLLKDSVSFVKEELCEGLDSKGFVDKVELCIELSIELSGVLFSVVWLAVELDSILVDELSVVLDFELKGISGVLDFTLVVDCSSSVSADDSVELNSVKLVSEKIKDEFSIEEMVLSELFVLLELLSEPSVLSVEISGELSSWLESFASKAFVVSLISFDELSICVSSLEAL